MTNRPIETFSAGNCEISVWENQGEEKIFHSVTAKRTYLDGNGEWRDAGSVHILPQQIPDMILVLQKSHEFLRMGLRQKRKQSPSNENGAADSEPVPDSRSPGDADAQTTFTEKESERRRCGKIRS